LDTNSEGEDNLWRGVICFFIHALIFLSNDRSSFGGAVEHAQTSGVTQTVATTNSTEDTRRNKVRVSIVDTNLGVGHTRESRSFKCKTFGAAHCHPRIVNEIGKGFRARHRIV
jgi:hypothetical protein